MHENADVISKTHWTFLDIDTLRAIRHFSPVVLVATMSPVQKNVATLSSTLSPVSPVSSVLEYYEVIKDLGHGHFGQVAVAQMRDAADRDVYSPPQRRDPTQNDWGTRLRATKCARVDETERLEVWGDATYFDLTKPVA